MTRRINLRAEARRAEAVRKDRIEIALMIAVAIVAAGLVIAARIVLTGV